MVKWSKIFDHDHGQSLRITVVNFDHSPWSKSRVPWSWSTFLTIDHGVNSRVSWSWSVPYPPSPRFLYLDSGISLMMPVSLLLRQHWKLFKMRFPGQPIHHLTCSTINMTIKWLLAVTFQCTSVINQLFHTQTQLVHSYFQHHCLITIHLFQCLTASYISWQCSSSN